MKSDILLIPLSSEKNIRMIEKENKLAFIVGRDSTARKVKEEVQKMFSVKVEKVNVVFDTKGRKKAYIKLSANDSALDVATDLGLL